MKDVATARCGRAALHEHLRADGAGMNASRGTGALLAVVAAFAAAFAWSGPGLAQSGTADATSVAVGRLAGPTRVETAVAISQRVFPDGADVAYLARADDQADAVAAGSLSDGPVLLVPGCGDLPSAAADELRRLQPHEVVALGGPGAVCDAVLQQAADVAGQQQSRAPAVVIRAEVAFLDASETPPFSVEATSPGIVSEGTTAVHEVVFRGLGDSVALDDPRFSGVLANGEGQGQLVAAGRGCTPQRRNDKPVVVCQDDFQSLVIRDGERTATQVRVHTDDDEVTATPLSPGTYVLDQQIRWEDDDVTAPEFDDGQAVVRVTYTVEEAPQRGAAARVVTWDTPEGTFRTNGHTAEELERIQDGIDRGEHIGIPAGKMARGDGGVNLGHDWHVFDVRIVDQAIEICDGTVAYVDAHLEEWLAEVGSYCPWGAVPLAVTPS
jgi:hypothetical protein